jgi:hypothetical protein
MHKHKLLPLVVLLALGSCKAVQPKPLCKVRGDEYIARYFDPVKSGTCSDEQILTTEIVQLQYYPPSRDDANDKAKMAIVPASIGDAVNDATHHMLPFTPGKDSAYSLGPFTTAQPDDSDICSVPTLSVATIMVGEIPGDAMAMPPVEAIPPRSFKYTWSNVKIRVTASSNALHFGADLVRQEDACIVTYKVSAITPIAHCGDAKKPVLDEDEKPVVDKVTGKPVLEDDLENGNPDPAKCDSSKDHEGLSPEILYECNHDLTCIPVKKFPSYRNPGDKIPDAAPHVDEPDAGAPPEGDGPASPPEDGSASPADSSPGPGPDATPRTDGRDGGTDSRG